MILIVGLGNPGKHYERTRHNVGFRVVDLLSTDVSMKKDSKANAEVGEMRVKGEKVLLVKPLRGMNLSGESVRSLVHKFKVRSRDVWVIYDDVDLPAGTVRIKRFGRGLGRHKGVQSIVEGLGTHEFPRIRIGIGTKSAIDLKEFVLSGFDKREEPLVEKSIAWAVQAITEALERGQIVSTTLTKGA